MERIIGKYTGKTHGPLLVIFGGIHGNEPAGIRALELVFKMLEVEPITNPDFSFKGRIIGLRGNLKALQLNQRFIQVDLNRQWTLENVAKSKSSDIEDLTPELQEMKEILALIDREIKDYQPERMIVLDLHTTTASGGIFTLATDDPESQKIALELHAPVVKGMLKGIRGTTLHYFNSDNFDVETIGVCFESGQHKEVLSSNRAIAAIINCMRTIGCVREQDVENHHDKLLIEHSKDLPKMTQLVTCHRISDEDDFKMLPDFKNFQIIKEGQHIANDKNGKILSSADGLILMPHYQAQGEDGYFLIQKINGF